MQNPTQHSESDCLHTSDPSIINQTTTSTVDHKPPTILIPSISQRPSIDHQPSPPLTQPPPSTDHLHLLIPSISQPPSIDQQPLSDTSISRPPSNDIHPPSDSSISPCTSNDYHHPSGVSISKPQTTISPPAKRSYVDLLLSHPANPDNFPPRKRCCHGYQRKPTLPKVIRILIKIDIIYTLYDRYLMCG